MRTGFVVIPAILSLSLLSCSDKALAPRADADSTIDAAPTRGDSQPATEGDGKLPAGWYEPLPPALLEKFRYADLMDETVNTIPLPLRLYVLASKNAPVLRHPPRQIAPVEPDRANNLRDTRGESPDAPIRTIARDVEPAVVGITCRVVSHFLKASYYGTGVCISANGLILTNITVAPENADDIRVYFKDGRIYPGQLIRADIISEGALIKIIPAPNATLPALPHVTLGNSDTLATGDAVYTFGRPLFFDQAYPDDRTSVSMGIISGIYDLKYNGDDQSRYAGQVIETDAAINPGSDGGPLIDNGGRLAGIISLAYNPNRKLGLAIPINKILSRFPELTLSGASTPPPTRPVNSALKIGARRIAPAVVRIYILRDITTPVSSYDALIPPRYMGLATRTRRVVSMPETARMGFCVNAADGLVVTMGKYLNGEVHDIVITAPGMDGPVRADLVARDFRRDIALLKTRAPLPTGVALPDDVALRPGDPVAVVGDIGTDHRLTMTTGIVSVLKRMMNFTTPLTQIDARVNYGNAGCPVIDLDGNLLGMTVKISADPFTPWGINSGVAFMVRSGDLAASLNVLKTGKDILQPPRPFLGVQSDRTPDATVAGVHIIDVMPGSAAEKAGIRSGDRLTAIDDTPIGDYSDMVRTLRSKSVGDTVRIDLIRDGKRLRTDVILGAIPGTTPVIKPDKK